MTVRADAGASKPKVCAATPVPFRAEVPSRASVPGAAPAPVPKPAPPPMATVRVLGSQLSQQDMAAMQKLPGFEVSFQVPMPTLLGALQRTDLLPQSQTHVAAATHAETPRAHIQEVHATQSIASRAHEQTTTHENPALPGPSLFGHEEALVCAATKHAPEPELPAFDVAKYLEAESSLYMLPQGVSLLHRDKTIQPPRILYDTCSQVNLLSKEFADRHGILYGPSPHKIRTSVGSSMGVVGQVVGPIYTFLHKGTDVEVSTTTLGGITFLVATGVDEMYDVLLSSQVGRDWGASPDPVLDLLEYRPFLITKADVRTLASVPLISTGDSNLRTAASAFLVCVTMHDSDSSDAPTKASSPQNTASCKPHAPATTQPASSASKQSFMAAATKAKKAKRIRHARTNHKCVVKRSHNKQHQRVKRALDPFSSSAHCHANARSATRTTPEPTKHQRRQSTKKVKRSSAPPMVVKPYQGPFVKPWLF